MDLDQLIHDADPAHGLVIDVPEPNHGPERSWHLGEVGLAVVVIVVCAAVTLLALQIHGHRKSGASPTTPAVLPLSSALPPGVGADVLARSAQIVETVPDPDGGPAWGLRTLETRDGMMCAEAGRTESGLLGGIGVDGAYHDDGTFHPFAIARFTGTGGVGDCEPNDAHGHAFINVSAVNTAMSAAEQTCLEHDDALPREHCPVSALRDVYFGLLGPDATSITYVGAGGHKITVPTVGPDGAYLIVRPLASGTCAKSVMRRFPAPSECDYDTQGDGIGANLSSGEITAVTYRGGRVCHLPAPVGVAVRLAQCPVVGYVAPAGPTYTAAEITAPVTVRTFPTADPGRNLSVDISWTARGAVRKTDQSAYSILIEYPKGCNAGGQSAGTHMLIHRGERVMRAFDVPDACRGTYTGEVSYISNLGPDGGNGGQLGTSVPAHDVFLVGRFSFEVR